MGNHFSREPTKAQGSGLSPSSTAESAKQISDVDIRASNSRPPSIGNISCDKPPEEPESVDTSHGVEATAVRKLAASTGTVAILGTTAQTPSKEPSSGFADEAITEEPEAKKNEVKVVENGPKEETHEPIRKAVTEEIAEVHSKSEKSEVPVTAPEHQITEAPSQVVVTELDNAVPVQNEVRQVPEITETLVASLEPSPVEESNPPIEVPPEPVNENKPKQNVENASEVSKIVSVESDEQIAQDNPPKTPKPPAPADEAKSENNDSTSTKTVDNDISSEQFKTNSLSDLSISELDDKESSALEQKGVHKEAVEDEGKLDEPSAESEKSESELKVTELTYESPSESSQPITKEESTSDVTTDNQQGESQLLGDEEPLVSESADENVEHRNEAAIKIQSSFRGFKTRKTLSVRRENRDVETEEDDKLTESEMENVKVQVEGMMKEAEETTESLRNTPEFDSEPTANAEEDFPAPPDAALLDEIEANEGSGDIEKDTTSLNLEPVPYPNSDAEVLKSKDQPNKPLSSDLKQQSSVDNGDSTTADMARMTADEDLPAPDMELLESSCTEDLNTEIINSEKVLEDDHHDSTEGDLTIEEDSEKLKEIQKPQECDELARGDSKTKGGEDASAVSPERPNQDAAATKIQANVRGFLTRKQGDKGKPGNGENEGTSAPGSADQTNDSAASAENESLEIVSEPVAKKPEEDDLLATATSPEPEAEDIKTESTINEEPPQATTSSPEKTEEIASTETSVEPAQELTVAESVVDTEASPDPPNSAEDEQQPRSPARVKSSDEIDLLASPHPTNNEEIEPVVEESVSCSADIVDTQTESAVEQSDMPDSPISKVESSKPTDAGESSSEEPQDLDSKPLVDEVQDRLSSLNDTASLDSALENTVEELKDTDASKDTITREPSKPSIESTNEIDQSTLETSVSPKVDTADTAASDTEPASHTDDSMADTTKSPIPVEDKEENRENGAGISEPEMDSAQTSISQQPQDDSTVETQSLDSAQVANNSKAEVSSKQQTAPDSESETAKESDSQNGSKTTSANANERLEQSETNSRVTSPVGENNNEVKIISDKESPVTNGCAIETPENDPTDLKDELLNASATKIQANVRGYLSRKKQISQQSDKH